VLGQGSVVTECELDLGDFGRFVVDLEVRYRSTVVTRTGHQSHKVGLRFVKLPSGAEHTLQRFIMQVQRDQRALASD
jgi:c-di-GMP-binding flagellar brake protein YcgR